MSLPSGNCARSEGQVSLVSRYSLRGYRWSSSATCSPYRSGWTAEATIVISRSSHSGCVIGDAPQDLSYAGAPTRTEVGDDNTFVPGRADFGSHVYPSSVGNKRQQHAIAAIA